MKCKRTNRTDWQRVLTTIERDMFLPLRSYDLYRDDLLKLAK